MNALAWFAPISAMTSAHASPKATRQRTGEYEKQYSPSVDSRYISRISSGTENTARNRNAAGNSGRQPHRPSPFNISQAARSDCARKNIQLTHTRWKMNICLSSLRSAPGITGLSLVSFRSTARLAPCCPPQMTNVRVPSRTIFNGGCGWWWCVKLTFCVNPPPTDTSEYQQAPATKSATSI
jgi:hypothetical protein